MPGRMLFRIALLAGLLVPLTVTSNSPRLTWYLFRVEGHVKRLSGSLDNYTVVLLRKSDGKWSRPQSCSEYTGTPRPVALTNVDGAYALSTVDCAFEAMGGLEYDTLAIAVVLPDTTMIGSPFRVGGVSPSVTAGTCTSGDGFACENEYDCVLGYTYEYPPRNITIP